MEQTSFTTLIGSASGKQLTSILLLSTLSSIENSVCSDLINDIKNMGKRYLHEQKENQNLMASK